MPIDEITQAELNIILLHIDGQNSLWIVPDINKDDADTFKRYQKTTDSIRHLIRLGILTDASDEPDMQEWIQLNKKENERDCYAVTITVQGMAMFGEILNGASKLPN